MRIKLDGVKSLVSALNRVEKKMKKQANGLVVRAAMRTASKAELDLQPHATDSRELAFEIGAVRQSITFIHDASSISAKVTAGNVAEDHLAAYLEFGTGVHAARHVPSLPAPFPQLAMQFFVNGRGQMKEHPFLIHNYLKEGERLKDKLKGLKVSW